jgi:hypothetical protein
MRIMIQVMTLLFSIMTLLFHLFLCKHLDFCFSLFLYLQKDRDKDFLDAYDTSIIR